MMTRDLLAGISLAAVLTISAAAQDAKPADNMAGMDMSGHDSSKMTSSDMHDMAGMGDGSAHAMEAMEGHHMDMGPHMKMTALRDPKPGDAEKAQQVVEAARKVAEKYKDYRVALADGFKI